MNEQRVFYKLYIQIKSAIVQFLVDFLTGGQYESQIDSTMKIRNFVIFSHWKLLLCQNNITSEMFVCSSARTLFESLDWSVLCCTHFACHLLNSQSIFCHQVLISVDRSIFFPFVSVPINYMNNMSLPHPTCLLCSDSFSHSIAVIS